jgi:hypothetical protein
VDFEDDESPLDEDGSPLPEASELEDDEEEESELDDVDSDFFSRESFFWSPPLSPLEDDELFFRESVA